MDDARSMFINRPIFARNILECAALSQTVSTVLIMYKNRSKFSEV